MSQDPQQDPSAEPNILDARGEAHGEGTGQGSARVARPIELTLDPVVVEVAVEGELTVHRWMDRVPEEPPAAFLNRVQRQPVLEQLQEIEAKLTVLNAEELSRDEGEAVRVALESVRYGLEALDFGTGDPKPEDWPGARNRLIAAKALALSAIRRAWGFVVVFNNLVFLYNHFIK